MSSSWGLLSSCKTERRKSSNVRIGRKGLGPGPSIWGGYPPRTVPPCSSQRHLASLHQPLSAPARRITFFCMCICHMWLILLFVLYVFCIWRGKKSPMAFCWSWSAFHSLRQLTVWVPLHLEFMSELATPGFVSVWLGISTRLSSVSSVFEAAPATQGASKECLVLAADHRVFLWNLDSGQRGTRGWG